MAASTELRDRQARSASRIAALRLLADNRAGDLLPADIAERVAAATSAVLAEARAAGRGALALGTAGGRASGLSLLAARQARLEHAAQDAIASAREAAQSGNVAALRQRLERFEVLTEAMWAIHAEVRGQDPASAPAAPAAVPRPAASATLASWGLWSAHNGPDREEDGTLGSDGE